MKVSINSSKLITNATAINMEVNENGDIINAVTVIPAMHSRYIKIIVLFFIFHHLYSITKAMLKNNNMIKELKLKILLKLPLILFIIENKVNNLFNRAGE